MYKNIFKLLIISSFPIFLLSKTICFDFLEICNKDKLIINLYLDSDYKKVSVEYGSKFKDLIDLYKLNEYDTSSYIDDYVLANDDTFYLSKNNTIKISINKSNLNELIKLKGIGIKTAKKIIEYREKYGYFTNIEEIKNVNGIGDKKYEEIKNLISI